MPWFASSAHWLVCAVRDALIAASAGTGGVHAVYSSGVPSCESAAREPWSAYGSWQSARKHGPLQRRCVAARAAARVLNVRALSTCVVTLASICTAVTSSPDIFFPQSHGMCARARRGAVDNVFSSSWLSAIVHVLVAKFSNYMVQNACI